MHRLYRNDWLGVMSHDGRTDSRWVDPTRTRTKSEWPYSYDEFFIFGNRELVTKSDSALYSDRIWEWDREKAERLWKEHVDCRWCGASAGQLSAFLTAYLRKPVRVTALAEGCNVSTGYPYWIAWFEHVSLPSEREG